MKKKNKNIKIFVVTHKEYKMPDNEIYLPIQVGAEGKKDLGFLKDNTGENISLKNPNYCELTAMYWAWKNYECDYIGLNHYRRYFTLKSKKEIKKSDDIFDNILNENDVQNLMEQYDVVVSNKLHLLGKTMETKYKQQHYISDLEITKKVISDMYPEYMESYETAMNKHEMSICNMFIMKKDLFDEYCEWLFNILFEVEKHTNIENYSTLQKRIYGFIAERLLNVWLEYHKELKIGTAQILSLEHDDLKTIIKKSYRRVLHIKS